jgi:hypothetical protein
MFHIVQRFPSIFTKLFHSHTLSGHVTPASPDYYNRHVYFGGAAVLQWR